MIDIKKKVDNLKKWYDELLKSKLKYDELNSKVGPLSDEENEELANLRTKVHISGREVEFSKRELKEIDSQQVDKISVEDVKEIIKENKAELKKINAEIQEKEAEIEEVKVKRMMLDYKRYTIETNKSEIDKLKKKKELINFIQGLSFITAESNTITDLQYLALADLVYNDFSKFQERGGTIVLQDIFNDKNNFTVNKEDSKNRWKTYKNHVGDWTFLEAYDPDVLLTREKTELTLEEQQFYAAAFQSPDKKEIVIAYRGTDGDNGDYDQGEKSSISKLSKLSPELSNLIFELEEFSPKLKEILEKEIIDKDPDFILEHGVTNRKIGAGTPGRQFELAEKFYKDIISNDRYEADNISFTGHSLAGGLAQYAAVISSDKSNSASAVKHTVTWNGIGIKAFSKVIGYEFFDEYISILQRLKDRGVEFLKEKSSIFRELTKTYKTLSERTLNHFEKKGYIKDGKITTEFLDDEGEVDIEKLESAIDNFRLKENLMDLDISDALLSYWDDYEIFDSYENIKKKLDFKRRFASYYRDGEKFKNKVRNYIISIDLTGNLGQHLGTTYIVDKELSKGDSAYFFPNADVDNILPAAEYHGFDTFFPYVHLPHNEASSNNALKSYNSNLKNRYGYQAKLGDITNKLSYDYLLAIVKKIMADITQILKTYSFYTWKNSNALFVLAKDHQEEGKNENDDLIKIIKETLRHSMRIHNKEEFDEIKGDTCLNSNKFYIRAKNGDNKRFVLTEANRLYKLDYAIVEQLNNMKEEEIDGLVKWGGIEGEKAILILGLEGLKDEEDIIDYNLTKDETELTNGEYKLEIQFRDPNLDDYSPLQANLLDDKEAGETYTSKGKKVNSENDKEIMEILDGIEFTAV
ncbi:hypothetical protein [Orenia marismortui]|uniref:hypothetical protein n=1 Tax=Orenia marismortui TaxID=46469 RepID=UPI00036A4337|nr:hypothetical protein [Orenia marismortui]